MKFGEISRTELIKKMLPYLAAWYFVDKAAFVFRHVKGNWLVRVLKTIELYGAAFKRPPPSIYPADMIAGTVGAAILWAVVYYRSKNAKKFRHGVEYGSARWGNRRDILPFVDPAFENNIILTKTESLTMARIVKNPKYGRNKNVIVVGGSGSGKTRFFVIPNLMQMHSSYVLSDPKGEILAACGKMLHRGLPKTDGKGKPIRDKNGRIVYEPYEIKVFNTIDFSKSMKYNPFMYIRCEKDILKLVNTLMENTKGEGGTSQDPFWEKAERLLYTAYIGYLWYEAPPKEQNFETLIEMIDLSQTREEEEDYENVIDGMFKELEEKAPNHFAVRQYRRFKLAAGKTIKSILISCGARLAPFDSAATRCRI